MPFTRIKGPVPRAEINPTLSIYRLQTSSFIARNADTEIHFFVYERADAFSFRKTRKELRPTIILVLSPSLSNFGTF